MKKLLGATLTGCILLACLTCDSLDVYNLAANGPEPAVIYIYFAANVDAAMQSGSVAYNINLSGWDAAQARCRDVALGLPLVADALRIQPFLSDDQRNMQDIVLPVYRDKPVHGINSATPTASTEIALRWSDLWGPTPLFTGTLASTIGLSAGYNIWTGSDGWGNYNQYTCNDWTSSVLNTQGEVGVAGGGPNWAGFSQAACSSLQALLCVAY